MPIRTGFVFEGVGFRYPGSDRWAVRGLDFSLAPGERMALVGENGAGKTTLVKLLARLYDPTEGRILLDGVDLREYDVESLRRNVGVIFQDFVRYDFMLRENIAVGNIGARGGRAARSRPPPSGAWPTRWPPGWPGRYDQMLGRRFEGGVDLSGGEWQKVALARAYMRDAQLLILDEPTAALDARAEYEVFLRFSELTAGRMAVLISHRFSTVRMADRILVLRGGELVEQGTHEALVAQGGLYAELFQPAGGGVPVGDARSDRVLRRAEPPLTEVGPCRSRRVAARLHCSTTGQGRSSGRRDCQRGRAGGSEPSARQLLAGRRSGCRNRGLRRQRAHFAISMACTCCRCAPRPPRACSTMDSATLRCSTVGRPGAGDRRYRASAALGLAVVDGVREGGRRRVVRRLHGSGYRTSVCRSRRSSPGCPRPSSASACTGSPTSIGRGPSPGDARGAGRSASGDRRCGDEADGRLERPN